MNANRFSADLPYPPTQFICPDTQDLRLITNDYAGCVSEFSAIAQYVYHQLRAKGTGFSHIGQSLLSISMVEMRHLNLLGEAIQQLGGDPRFFYQIPQGCASWDGRMITYGCHLKDMLQADLQLEQSTIQHYLKHAAQARQQALSDLLLRIVEDERIHVRVLQELLDEVAEMVPSS